jgi:hypothetical protein
MAFKLTPYVEREHQEQIQDASTLRILLRPGVCWTAIDHAHSLNRQIGRNGQEIGLLEAKLRKARGVRRGVPDFLFWADGLPYAIERKIKGGVLSEAQKEFQEELRVARVPVATCWSQREVCDTLTAWGLMRPYQDAA